MAFTLMKGKAGECARCKIDAPAEDNNHSNLYSDFSDEGWCEECVRYEYEGIEEDQHFNQDDDDIDSMFADPGGNSALRAETDDNPCNLPCPTCHVENVLTLADVNLGYQCDSCANRLERGMDY